jgi:hypothetical protein
VPPGLRLLLQRAWASILGMEQLEAAEQRLRGEPQSQVIRAICARRLFVKPLSVVEKLSYA